MVQAREEARGIVSAAEQEAARIHQERQEAAEIDAKRRSDAVLATVAVEIARFRLARAEEWLQSIHDQARDRLRTHLGYDFGVVMTRLAAEALGHMSGEAFVIRLAPVNERMIGNEILDGIRSQTKKHGIDLQVITDPALKDDSVVIEDREKHQSWNISLEVRLERLWPEVRRQIAVQAGVVEEENRKRGA